MDDFVCEEQSRKKGKIERFLYPLLGVTVVALSACAFSFTNAIVKWLEGIDPFTISVSRFCGIFLGALPFTLYNYFKHGHSPAPAGKRLALFGRSILGCLTLLAVYYGFKHIPLADVNLITASAPIFTVFSARIFIKEPICKLDLLNTGLILIGVTMIVKPPFMFGETEIYTRDPEAWIAILVVLLASIFLLSNAYTLVRFLRDLPLSTVMINMGFYGLIVSVICALAFGCRCLPDSTDTGAWVLFVMTGIASFPGQLGLAFGARFETAARVSLYREAFELLFSFVFQISFFEDVPDALTIVGAVIVVISIFLSFFKTYGMKGSFDVPHFAEETELPTT